MKRLLFVPLLLGITAIIITNGMISAKKYSAMVIDTIKSADEQMLLGNTEKATELTQKAENIWIEAENVLNLYLNRADTSQVGLTLSRLVPLSKYGEIGEYLAESNNAKIQLIHISALESIQ